MNITQNLHYLIKILCCWSLFLTVSCNNITTGNKSEKLKDQQKGFIVFPSGKKMKVSFALTIPDQTRGLSGKNPKDFQEDEILWFYYLFDDYRSFWMPDTYFDLDIIFIDKDLKIVRVVKDVPYHVGYGEPPMIARTPAIYSRHVLEIKSSSPFRDEFKDGLQLEYQGESLQQIERDIRQN